MDEYYHAIRALPSWLARPLAELPIGTAERVHEVRLRVGCGVRLTLDGTPDLPPELEALGGHPLTSLQMEEIFCTLCGGSVHTHQAEVAQGFVTLPDGCRAGLGRTEAEQECQRLEQYADKFRMALAQCRAELQQRRALSRRLGLAAGMALGVLLL